MLRRILWGESADNNDPFLTRVRKNPFRFLVILLCLVNITLIAINIGVWTIAAYQKLFFAADFTSFYTSFYLVRVGEGANIYNSALQSIYQRQLMGGLTFEGGVLRYANPPFIAILFSPLSYLRLDAAFYIWTLMQLGLLIWCLIKMNQIFQHWEKHEYIVLVITILAFWPLTNSFLLGQFSIFLLLCVTQLYDKMRNSRLIKAGIWLALMTVKPQTILIPGMMSLNKRYWRVAIYAVITALLLFLTSSIILGFKPWLQYIQALRDLGSYFGKYGVDPKTEFTFRGVLSNILGNTLGNLTNTISMLILILAMFLIWFIWRKGISQNHPRFILYFAFTISLSVFLSLHLNPHDALILVLPAALFYDYLRVNNLPRNAYTVLLLISPLVFFIAAFSDVNIFGFLRPPIILIFAMLIWMVRYILVGYRSDRMTSVSNV